MVVGLIHPQYEHENEACAGILGQYCILFVNPGLYGGLKEADTTNEPPYLESLLGWKICAGGTWFSSAITWDSIWTMTVWRTNERSKYIEKIFIEIAKYEFDTNTFDFLFGVLVSGLLWSISLSKKPQLGTGVKDTKSVTVWMSSASMK